MVGDSKDEIGSDGDERTSYVATQLELTNVLIELIGKNATTQLRAASGTPVFGYRWITNKRAGRSAQSKYLISV
jgi:hypothetical protein